MKRTDVVALLSGVLFAVGLGVSGMTQPQKVIGFLDVTGQWDPSLALVMVGAIIVHALVVLAIARRPAPRFAPSFVLPHKRAIDGRLLLGAALFGIGWGVSGFCPGPALVSVVTLAPSSMAFVAAMLVGMAIHHFAIARRARVAGDAASAGDVRGASADG